MTAEILEQLAGSMRQVEGIEVAEKIGVAVSGGGDSMALLALLADWRKTNGIQLHSVSVNHGIRPESGRECEQVGEFSQSIGVDHEILMWAGPLTGNLQSGARRARYALIAEWAKSRDMGYVALGHNLDDQAETVLLNLARGSGVDGLSAMPVCISRLGIRWVRPLLQVRRNELRNYLGRRNIRWIDDPSNEESRFDRIKARTLLQATGPLGLTSERLVATAQRMQEARAVLESVAAVAAQNILTENGLGDFHVGAGFWRLERETRLRLAADIVRRVGNSEYRPRLAALRAALADIRLGKRTTLGGCMAVPGEGSSFWLVREPASCSGPVPAEQCWDGRWCLAGRRAPPGSVVGPLGEAGLGACKEWRSTGFIRESLLVSPALRNRGELLAAPFAGLANGWIFRRTWSGSFCGLKGAPV